SAPPPPWRCPRAAPPPGPPPRAGGGGGAPPPAHDSDSWGERFGFGVVSLVLAIPLSAIAVVNADLPGLLIAWTGIVGVNALHAVRGMPRFGATRKQRDSSDWED
ncbi:hypothetical protein ACFC4G_33760, partial [Streptomyces sp. NPDC056002]